MLYPNQIVAGIKVFNEFVTKLNSYVMLLAEMQSGKTGTFMFIACEMLFKKKVNKVVIFSGNRETELRIQNEKQDIFYEAYRRLYMEDTHKKSREEAFEFTQSCKKRIEVVWGPKLKTYARVEKTLYIWEESHYGQSQKQEVDKFLTRMGIQATGSTSDGDYLLSVSATPFSELCDDFHLKQGKPIVRLNTIPKIYTSVAQMKSNDQIKVYTNLTKQFTKNMHKHDKYGIVRASDKTQENLSKIAKSNGWLVIQYDQKHKGVPLDTILDKEPTQKTIIFLKGMVRMGKQLNKTHISFVMETSISKTDTLLQGLLGRVCGYDSRDDIYVYLPEKTQYSTCNVYEDGAQKYTTFIEDGKTKRRKVTEKTTLKPELVFRELDRFIGLYDGENLKSIPLKGSNLKLAVDKVRKAIIPLRIKLDSDQDAEISDTIIDSIMAGAVDSKNSPEITAKILDIAIKISGARKNFKTIGHITPENIMKDHFKFHKKMKPETFDAIEKAFDDGIATCEFGSGYGVAAHEDEIAVFINKKGKYLYITAQLPDKNVCVPTTTRREVFCRKAHMPEITFGAACIIPIDPLCSTQPDILLSTLKQLSTVGRGFPAVSKITSNGGQYKGVTLTPAVFDALKGFISGKLLKEDNVTINYKLAKGPKTEMVRLSEISWSY